MAKTRKILYRVMDTDNAGIEWSNWRAAEVTDNSEDPEIEVSETMTDTARDTADEVNRISHEECAGPFGPDTPDDVKDPPGKLIAARGDARAGIAWFEDRGHQGATTIIFEWKD